MHVEGKREKEVIDFYPEPSARDALPLGHVSSEQISEHVSRRRGPPSSSSRPIKKVGTISSLGPFKVNRRFPTFTNFQPTQARETWLECKERDILVPENWRIHSREQCKSAHHSDPSCSRASSHSPCLGRKRSRSAGIVAGNSDAISRETPCVVPWLLSYLAKRAAGHWHRRGS